MVDRFIAILLKFPKHSLFLATLAILLLSSGLFNFSEKHDVRIWFNADDPQMKVLDDFERRFGNDESVVLAIHHPEGIFNPSSLELIQKMTEQTWLIKQIIRVDSLANFSITESVGDDINTQVFLPDDPTRWEFKKLQDKALNHRVMPGYLISKDAKTALIYARIVPSIAAQPNYEILLRDFNSMLEKFNDGNHRFYLAGQASVTDAFREISNNDMKTILPVLFLAIVFILALLFKNFKSVLYPLVVTFSTLAATMGFLFIIGMQFNSVLSIIPGIITAICIADSVHLVSSYRQALEKGMINIEASIYALKKNFIPTLLTSISTSVGFLSLATANLLPVEQLGYISGFGCLLAWFISYFVLGPLFVLFPMKVEKKGQESLKRANPTSMKMTSVIKQFKLPIILLFSSVVIFSIVESRNIQINANPYEYFKQDTELFKTNKFLKDNLGGTAGPEIVISSGKADGIKDPKFLAKVTQLKNFIESHPQVTKTIDIIDIIREMNMSLNGGDKNFYRIPNSQRAVAEQLFLYQMSLPPGMDLNNRMSLDYESIRMSVLWTIDETKLSLEMVDQIELKAKDIGLEVKVTGKFLLLQRMSDYIIETFVKSITLAFFIVSILMMIVFKSVKIGLISLIPNVVPLLFGGLFMYAGDVYLNFGTALVFSVCLGIAVDDTIHFLSNYHRLTKVEGKTIEEAIGHIFTYTGNALLFTTVILVLAFGLFMLGDFIPNVQFGALCALILTAALAVDLIFLPALLMTFRKKA